jgi:hypothetical protein
MLVHLPLTNKRFTYLISILADISAGEFECTYVQPAAVADPGFPNGGL